MTGLRIWVLDVFFLVLFFLNNIPSIRNRNKHSEKYLVYLCTK